MRPIKSNLYELVFDKISFKTQENHPVVIISLNDGNFTKYKTRQYFSWIPSNDPSDLEFIRKLYHKKIYFSWIFKDYKIVKLINSRLFPFYNEKKTNKVCSLLNTSSHFYSKTSVHEKCPYLELFWTAFLRISTKYGEIVRISPYSV